MSKLKIAVLVFPGSNCDQDMYHAWKDVMGFETHYVFHTESSLEQFDAVAVPGGFSYGDYLRCGAIARFSPIMQAVKDFAETGKPVIGVCNGFQILLEAGLLEGALMRNEGLSFICKPTPLRVVCNDTMFSSAYKTDQIINIPIAHGEGNYYCDEDTYHRLKTNRQIVFEYTQNPNGSVHDVAGITNKRGNVLGMMPHPERAIESLLGLIDGRPVFESIQQHLQKN